MMNKAGRLCLLLGAVLIAAALLFLRSSRLEDLRAGDAAQAAVAKLQQLAGTGHPLETGGNTYIGYLTFPEREVSLPVMSDWSYDKLKISPCRHFGAQSSDNLVIAAHNYESHFGFLQDMQEGEAVCFTGPEGVTSEYITELILILDANEVDTVKNSGFDLVLYTCSITPESRIAVFLNRA